MTINDGLNIIMEYAPAIGVVLGTVVSLFASSVLRYAKKSVKEFLTPENVVDMAEDMIEDYSKHPEELTKVLKGFEQSGVVSQGVSFLKLYLEQKIDEMEDKILNWEDKIKNDLTSDTDRANRIIANYKKDIEQYSKLLKATDEK